MSHGLVDLELQMRRWPRLREHPFGSCCPVLERTDGSQQCSGRLPSQRVLQLCWAERVTTLTSRSRPVERYWTPADRTRDYGHMSQSVPNRMRSARKMSTVRRLHTSRVHKRHTWREPPRSASSTRCKAPSSPAAGGQGRVQESPPERAGRLLRRSEHRFARPRRAAPDW